MKKLLLILILVLGQFNCYSQELEVFKTDSVTAVRCFLYITGNANSWIKSGAVILSRIKNYNNGKEIFGFSIATVAPDIRAREIPEGVAILIKHLDTEITEIYTESGEYTQKEKTLVLGAASRYFAFATTISSYSYSYSCEISIDVLRKIAQWGIIKIRVDTPGSGWKDFELSSDLETSRKQLVQMAEMAKRILSINMEEVKPDSYTGF